MVVMVKTLMEQNKAMVEMMKTQSDKNKIPDPSNFAKRPAEIQKSSKIINGSHFKVARLGHP